MKSYLSILVVLFLAIGLAQPVMAQKKSKAERKKEKAEKKLWKKKAKSYKKSPLALRDDLENANKKLRQCSERNKELQNKFGALENTIDSLQVLVNSRNAEIAALKTKYEKLQMAYEAQKNINEKGIVPGLVYRVQVGAYVHFDMNQHLQHTDKTFEGESQDGMNKYLMGNFREFAMSEAFRDDVRKLGIKDAWVVPYIDGTRVTMDEATKYRGSSSKGRGDTSGKKGIKGRNSSKGSKGKNAIKNRRGG
ncbi:MAG TPA: hypothetical protein ENJ82_16245 [Bacteroidetes bacterium]|nr:hypothetical protein [Bacteroidota bacterium]